MLTKQITKQQPDDRPDATAESPVELIAVGHPKELDLGDEAVHVLVKEIPSNVYLNWRINVIIFKAGYISNSATSTDYFVRQSDIIACSLSAYRALSTYWKCKILFPLLVGLSGSRGGKVAFPCSQWSTCYLFIPVEI